MNDIIIHTDGSCLHNPGRGGWAAVIEDGQRRRELSGGARLSTNNRMEIRAAIEALRAVPESENATIKLFTDSQLLVNSIELGWARKWRANNWMRNRNDKAENPDLWKQLLEEIDKRKVKFIWTKAHVGTLENERCDQLAKAAAEAATDVDEVYENTHGAHQHRSQSTLFGSELGFGDFVVQKHKGGSSITISHAQRGTITVPITELPALLARIKETIAADN